MSSQSNSQNTDEEQSALGPNWFANKTAEAKQRGKHADEKHSRQMEDVKRLFANKSTAAPLQVISRELRMTDAPVDDLRTTDAQVNDIHMTDAPVDNDVQTTNVDSRPRARPRATPAKRTAKSPPKTHPNKRTSSRVGGLWGVPTPVMTPPGAVPARNLLSAESSRGVPPTAENERWPTGQDVKLLIGGKAKEMSEVLSDEDEDAVTSSLTQYIESIRNNDESAERAEKWMTDEKWADCCMRSVCHGKKASTKWGGVMDDDMEHACKTCPNTYGKGQSKKAIKNPCLRMWCADPQSKPILVLLPDGKESFTYWL